jgi:quercetin dioxygenase-like cupin family protein
VPGIRAADAPVWDLDGGWRMTGLAAPSRGSSEISAWRVHMEPAAPGPLHRVDHEIVLIVLEGTASVFVEGETFEVPAGDAFIIPAGTERHLTNTADQPCELISVMSAAGRSKRSDGEPSFIPWVL